MKIKSRVWYWLAAGCGCLGLLYGMGIEGSAQTGSSISDSQFVTALCLVLAAVASCGWALPPRIVNRTTAAMAALTAPTPVPRSRITDRTGGAHEHDCICLRLPQEPSGLRCQAVHRSAHAGRIPRGARQR